MMTTLKSHYKIILITVFCTHSFIVVKAQVNKTQLTVGYVGQAFIQPGLKIGGQINVHLSEKETNSSFQKTRSIFLRHQVAFYSRPNNHSNVLLHHEGGLQWKNKPNKHSALALGLGYQWRSTIKSLTVNLGSGEIESSRQWQESLIPTISYEIERDIHPQISLYSRLTTGVEFTDYKENSMIMFFDLGIKLKLNNSKND